MRRIRALIVKEFIQIFRDKLTLTLIIGIPIMQLLIFGFAINTDVKHLKTAVLDMARTQESRELLDQFSGSMYFDVVRSVGSFGELNEAVGRGDVKVGIAIPPDFSNKTTSGKVSSVQVIVDATDSMSASSAIAAATTIGMLSSQKILTAELDRMGVDPQHGAIDVRIRPWYNPDFVTSWYMVPGIIGALMTMTLTFMVGMAIVRESEQGTLEQLLVTPMRSWEMLASKVVPYVLLAYVQLLVAIIFGVYIFRMPFRGSMTLFLSLTFFFILAALSVGIMISTFAKNERQAIQLAILNILPNILLSGFMFPVEAMPEIFQALSRIVPMTYYLKIARHIILKGSPFAYVWRDALALFVFASSLFSAGLAMFHKRYLP
ncbi:MAG: ABC transporter permease [Synergistaceae bacterium]|jgi:ABC-2 type transport system permease protein|nr:ABC transporter permease [Synergistaceae bacterium]